MKFIRIRNWAKYQHYKNRNPLWTKLYGEMMTSLDWVSSNDASRALMVGLMTLAAKHDNKIPHDGTYIQRVCYLNSFPDFTQLIELQFIEIIESASKKSEVDSAPEKVAIPEVEKEKSKSKRREEKKEPASSPVDSPLIVELPLNDGSAFEVRQVLVDEMVKLYPAVGIVQEFRNMRGWLLSNQQKRKTKSGILRFANNWLSKQQNSGGNGNGQQSKANQRTSRNEELLNRKFEDSPT